MISKESNELVDALTDLATRLSDEWCAKGHAETKDLDFGAIHDEQAAAQIDAAFAKVREECADRFCVTVCGCCDYTVNMNRVCRRRAAILGTEADKKKAKA